MTAGRFHPKTEIGSSFGVAHMRAIRTIHKYQSLPLIEIGSSLR
jgi:hypothetical protein